MMLSNDKRKVHLLRSGEKSTDKELKVLETIL